MLSKLSHRVNSIQSALKGDKPSNNTGKGDAEPPSLMVVIVLDTTASMSQQIRGSQQATKLLLEHAGRLAGQRNMRIKVMIVEFTEDGQRTAYEQIHTVCHVASAMYELPAEMPEALERVNSIQLSTTRQGTRANGGDGPENTKAALAHTALKLQQYPDYTSIVFLMTDAQHHVPTSLSNTAVGERDWLEYVGAPTGDDMEFLQWTAEQVPAHKCIYMPVLYGACPRMKAFHCQLALRLYGKVLLMSKVVAADLAMVLSSIVNNVVSGMCDLDRPLLDLPDTLSVIEPYGSVDLRFSDTDLESPLPMPCSGQDARDQIESAIGHATAVVTGKGCQHRSIVVGDPAGQLRLVLRALHLALSPDINPEDLQSFETACQQLKDSLPASIRGHVAMDADLLQECLFEYREHEESPELFVDGPGESSITLCTTLEQVQELEGELSNLDAQEDVLQLLAKCLMGYPVDIRLPVVDGQADFKCSWAAVVEKISTHTLTLADHFDLVRCHPEGASGWMQHPVTKEAYNCHVPLVTCPEDALVYRLASATQMLNLCVGKALGCPTFVPHIATGITCSVVVRLVRPGASGITEANWKMLRRAMLSVNLLAKKPADIANQLRNRTANPEDTPAKCLCGVLDASSGVTDEERAEIALLGAREWMATRVQARFKPSGAETSVEATKRYLMELGKILSLDAMGLPGFDGEELQAQLHPLEREDMSLRFGSERMEKILTAFAQMDLYKELADELKVIWALFRGVSDHEHMKTMELSREDHLMLLRLFLLRYRTARYSHADGQFTMLPSESMHTLLATKLREVYTDELREVRAIRIAAAKEKLIGNVVGTVLVGSGQGDSFDTETFAAKLCAVSLDLDGEQTADATNGPRIAVLGAKDIVLGRSDVPALLEAYGKMDVNAPHRDQIVEALVASRWTTAQPNSLKAHEDSILAHVTDSGVRATIQLALCGGDAPCAREIYNRHGHSLSVVRRTPCEFTLEYAEARLKNLEGEARYARVEMYLERMEQVFNAGNAAIAAAKDEHTKATLRAKFEACIDANQAPAF